MEKNIYYRISKVYQIRIVISYDNVVNYINDEDIHISNAYN